jgi:hypothetical protein
MFFHSKKVIMRIVRFCYGLSQRIQKNMEMPTPSPSTSVQGGSFKAAVTAADSCLRSILCCGHAHVQIYRCLVKFVSCSGVCVVVLFMFSFTTSVAPAGWVSHRVCL